MIDAHTWWRMGDRNYGLDVVRRIAEEMSEYEIAWLEEPLPPEDHESYRQLREENLVPIASGEHEPDEPGYLDLIATGSVDYVQMDVVCQGGYPLARRILPEIASGGLKFAFHSWGTALEVMAAAHLGICWPESVVEWLEYPCYSTPQQTFMYAFPMAAQILSDPLHIDHGDLIVPRGPGLGVGINENVVERYPWLPGAWSSFSINSPSQTWSVSGDHSVQWSDQH
jgi:L-alanine-DL-glutamate epimerase-like enolase superfamily enzyme